MQGIGNLLMTLNSSRKVVHNPINGDSNESVPD